MQPNNIFNRIKIVKCNVWPSFQFHPICHWSCQDRTQWLYPRVSEPKFIVQVVSNALIYEAPTDLLGTLLRLTSHRLIRYEIIKLLLFRVLAYKSNLGLNAETQSNAEAHIGLRLLEGNDWADRNGFTEMIWKKWFEMVLQILPGTNVRDLRRHYHAATAIDWSYQCYPSWEQHKACAIQFLEKNC